jgi:peptidoglycan/LPS O-acetylase OafA/YrhL
MLALRLKNPSPLPQGGRMRPIDELKGLAMLMVILYHGGGLLGWQNWLHGEIGVDVFLIVSGFTLARTSNDMPWPQFLRRRLLRIFPAYWCALATFVVLNQHYFGSKVSTANLVTHVLGIHGLVLNPPDIFAGINDSFWFITLILLMYVVYLALRRHRADLSRVLGVALLLTTVVFWYFMRTSHSGGIGHFAMRVPSFFIGLAGAQLLGSEETELRLTPLLCAGLIGISYLGFVRGFIPFYAFGGVAVILVFFVARQSLMRHPDGRFLLSVLAVVGVYSYEIFLFHQPLIRDYNRIFWSRCFGLENPGAWRLAIGIIGGLAITFAISWSLHRAINWIFSWSKESTRTKLPLPSTHPS